MFALIDIRVSNDGFCAYGETLELTVSYEEALDAAGAKVLEFKNFG